MNVRGSYELSRNALTKLRTVRRRARYALCEGRLGRRGHADVVVTTCCTGRFLELGSYRRTVLRTRYEASYVCQLKQLRTRTKLRTSPQI